MIKVKINGEWVKDVTNINSYIRTDYKIIWVVESLSRDNIEGQIQDIKLVEDEPEKIDKLDKQSLTWQKEYLEGLVKIIENNNKKLIDYLNKDK